MNVSEQFNQLKNKEQEVIKPKEGRHPHWKKAIAEIIIKWIIKLKN